MAFALAFFAEHGVNSETFRVALLETLNRQVGSFVWAVVNLGGSIASAASGLAIETSVHGETLIPNGSRAERALCKEPSLFDLIMPAVCG